jgi:NAD(P)-dependent dehydrogenase (short-subunit alcohol dehydrogenase family)
MIFKKIGDDSVMKIDFTGKNIVSTGAGAGLGKAVAIEFAKSQANLWFGDISKERAEATLSELKGINPNGKFGFTVMDISKKEDVQKLFDDAVTALGEIRSAANCAGVFFGCGFIDATPEDIHKHLSINLYGTIYFDQVAMGVMIKQGKPGNIVNIASVGGRRGDPGAPYYALGKAGIIQFTQSAALVGAKYDIKVNSVCPGIIRTPLWNTIFEDIAAETGETDYDKIYNGMVSGRVPLGRDQSAEEIAYGVIYLASDCAYNITGQSWNICGGDAMN